MTLLSHFWRDDDPVELTAAIGRDWADVLEGLPKDAIEAACLRHLRESDRKPVPARIYQYALDAMPRPVLVRPAAQPVPKPERITKQAADEIMTRAGYRPRRMGDENAG